MTDKLVANSAHADLLKIASDLNSSHNRRNRQNSIPSFTRLKTLYAVAKAVCHGEPAASFLQTVSQISTTEAGTATAIDKDGTFVSLTTGGLLNVGRMWVTEAVNPAFPNQRDSKIYV